MSLPAAVEGNGCQQQRRLQLPDGGRRWTVGQMLANFERVTHTLRKAIRHPGDENEENCENDD